jgi:hypothetical protein
MDFGQQARIYNKYVNQLKNQFLRSGRQNRIENPQIIWFDADAIQGNSLLLPVFYLFLFDWN